MPEIETRYPCPVCLGVKLRRTSVSAGLYLDHCERCGGFWFQRGQAALLHQQPPEVLWKAIRQRHQVHLARCHACTAPMRRDLSHCPVCAVEESLECPNCTQPMQAALQGTHRLDVCRDCQSVWFDHHEVVTLWHAQFRFALESRRSRASSSALAPGVHGGHGSQNSLYAVDILADTLFYAPDLAYYGARGAVEVAGAAAHGAADVASGAAEALSSAPGAGGALLEVAGSAASGAVEIAGATAEVAGEAAAGVFEVIVEIIGGILG